MRGNKNVVHASWASARLERARIYTVHVIDSERNLRMMLPVYSRVRGWGENRLWCSRGRLRDDFLASRGKL
jgi:hypothetical protein